MSKFYPMHKAWFFYYPGAIKLEDHSWISLAIELPRFKLLELTIEKIIPWGASHRYVFRLDRAYDLLYAKEEDLYKTKEEAIEALIKRLHE